LLAYVLPCPATRISSITSPQGTKLRNCWTFGTAFNRVQLIAQLMESASSHLRTGQRGTFWALTIW